MKYEIDLKPCPHCGGPAVLLIQTGAQVVCPKCGARTDDYVDDIVISDFADFIYSTSAIIMAANVWNRRVKE